MDELQNALVSMDEKVVRFTERLEKTDLRFYMYDDPAIERPDMKESLLKGKGRALLLERYKSFALSEVYMLEHFKTHPLRTFDPMQADLYIIPLSVTTILTQVHKTQTVGKVYNSAFGALYNTSIFNQPWGIDMCYLCKPLPPFHTIMLESFGITLGYHNTTGNCGMLQLAKTMIKRVAVRPTKEALQTVPTFSQI